MGACFSDVQTKDQAGVAAPGALFSISSEREEAANAVALVTGSASYSSWVEIQVTCKDLRTADTFSRSDPLVVLMQKDHTGWKEAGRTEVISNNESPSFVKKFRILYNFEVVQEFRLEVVDVDKNNEPTNVDVRKCNKLGEVEFKLSDVLLAPQRSLVLRLLHTPRASTIILVAEELSGAREVLTMQLAARGLTDVEVFSRSDPFLEISKSTEAGTWLPVFKTEVVDSNLSPVWKEFKIKGTQLNNGDPNRPLRIKVYDYEDSGKHHLLGEAETNALKLQELSQSGSWLQLTGGPNPKQRAGAGEVQVRSFNVTSYPSFLDYLQAGSELGFMVAIDFTASNGHPNDAHSLHFLHGGPTIYESAITGVGRVLEAYDTDKIFQCYGFGCKAQRGGGTVQHCAPLGGQDPQGSCQGITGLLQAYRQAFDAWELSGPTLFSPVLRRAVATASRPQGGKVQYTVLLILTDGVIMDMQDTIDTIVAASRLPLSILIVGVGNSPDLAKMDVLDADKKSLIDSKGTKAARDNVQFVRFSQHRNDGVALATELLAELPGQFLAWVRTNNVPLPQRFPVVGVPSPLQGASAPPLPT